MPSAPASSSASEKASPSFLDVPMEWLETSPRYRLARRWYLRHEEVSGSLLFFGGVT